MIVQPGGVYGPDDHSAIGKQLLDFVSGRLPLVPFGEVGMDMVHVEDVATGVLLALDKGRVGESYVLGDQITTMRGLLDTAANVAGRRPPRGNLPTGVMKAIALLGPVVGPVMGQPPNFRELISSADGVTFWAKQDKAVAELGFAPGGLETGLRQTLEAEGKLRPGRQGEHFCSPREGGSNFSNERLGFRGKRRSARRRFRPCSSQDFGVGRDYAPEDGPRAEPRWPGGDPRDPPASPLAALSLALTQPTAPDLWFSPGSQDSGKERPI